MTPTPIISVIVPVYNIARYIASTLQSALSQTYRDFEVIVVDDGSTDDTPRIVESFVQSSGGRVCLLRQSNHGCGAARNTALDKARGQWIALLDGDDIWQPDKLEKQLTLASRNPRAGLIYCHTEYIDEQDCLILNYPRPNRSYRGQAVIELFCEYFLLLPGVIFRHEIIDRVGLFDPSLRVGEDYEFFLRVLAVTEIDLVEEPLLKRRVIPNSLSRLSFVDDWLTDLKTLHTFLKHHPELIQLHPERVTARLGSFHFSLAYHCLECGYNRLALEQLFRALRYERSWRILKNILLCSMPLSLRRSLKILVAKLSTAGTIK